MGECYGDSNKKAVSRQHSGVSIFASYVLVLIKAPQVATRNGTEYVSGSFQ
jgi:hypothetical protein